jgi:lipopolysaccharide export system protein LptC
VRPRASTLFPLALVIALAAITFWLERAVQVGGPGGRDAQRHDPDFMAENFTATQLDAEGRPRSTLTAAKMVHYSDDDSSELDAPRLVRLRENGPPLRVRSDRGTVSKDGEEVRFYGNVVLTREASAERPELRVDTSFLLVLPNQDLASTPEPVLITEGRSRLSGVGMKVNSATRELWLQSRVQGVFERASDQ